MNEPASVGIAQHSAAEAVSQPWAVRGPRTRATGGVKSFPSPASSSASSSEFEFTVTQSPGSKQRSAAQLCPADDLFYKGQLLPLHLSPRISMVRTLLLASASTSSASASDSTSTSNSSRDSNGSTSSSFSTDCAALLLPDSAPSSSRPSSATDEDRHLNLLRGTASYAGLPPAKRTGKQYLSSFATRFSSVFLHRGGAPAAKKPSNKSVAKEVIKKYAKKVKPLYEKLSQIPKNQSNGSNQPQPQPPAQQQQQQQCFKKPFSFSIRKKRGDEDQAAASAAAAAVEVGAGKYAHSNSFSGNLRFPRQKRCAASCPSSMRSSPNHSGMLSFGGAGGVGFPDVPAAAATAMAGSIGMGPVSLSAASSSSMEELQSAIEGAIAHCKNTMGGVVSLCPRKGAAATAGEISAF